MRHAAAVSSALIVLAACADAPEPRPDRENLLAAAGELSGRQIVEEPSGPWVVRKIESSAPGEEPVAEGERVVRRFRVDGEAPGESADYAFDYDAEVAEEPAPMARPAEPEAGLGEIMHRDGGAALPALRAGSTDDNEDFDAWLAFLAEQEEAGTLARCQPLDVSARRTIRVVDADGAPVPAAAVRVVDADRDVVLWRGSTYGDGRVPFYASMLPAADARTFLLEIDHGDRTVREHWNGKGDEVVVRLPGAPAARDEIELDVVFLIDTTGSMSDEIERIKQSLLATTQKLRNVDREFDLRYGAVLYRDIADQYVTKAHPFTSDIEAFDGALQEIEAGGGGDTPESLNQGLAVAVDGMEWRAGAAKLVFLVADAPPHMDYEGDVPYGDSARAAIARGIKVHSVAASGLDIAGTVVFRQIAQLTRGKFIFIEYGGSVKKTAEGHGVGGEVKSNNLDDILFEQIRDEIAGWGR